MPRPGQRAEVLGSEAIEKVVAGDHDERHGRYGPAWQPDQRREHNHRSADRKDDSCAQPVEVELESPPELDQREVDQDQPNSTGDEKAAKFARAPRAAIEKGREPGEKNKGRRADMGDPTRQEQCRFGDVARIEAARTEEVARVVQRHERHHQAAQNIDRDDARRPAAGHGDLSGRAGRWSSSLFPGHGSMHGGGEFSWGNHWCQPQWMPSGCIVTRPSSSWRTARRTTQNSFMPTEPPSSVLSIRGTNSCRFRRGSQPKRPIALGGKRCWTTFRAVVSLPTTAGFALPSPADALSTR